MSILDDNERIKFEKILDENETDEVLEYVVNSMKKIIIDQNKQ